MKTVNVSTFKDRFLAATALVSGRRLMTADRRLLAATSAPTVPARE